MTSALVVTNGACSPCASASRLSTNTMARPPRIPMMVPSTACSASIASTCPHDPSPADRYSTRRTVSRTANGSLLPDSTSSVAPTRGRRRKPRAWTRKNTRRGRGRAHAPPPKQRLAPAHVEQVPGDGGGHPRRDHDADGRQRGRGRQHAAEGRKPRTQAAVEQDQRQRDRADQI